MRRDAERLADIIEAAGKITARVAKGRETFDKDEDVQIVLVMATSRSILTSSGTWHSATCHPWRSRCGRFSPRCRQIPMSDLSAAYRCR